MQANNANNYFQDLSKLLLSIEVSDKDGASQLLDHGAREALKLICDVAANDKKVILVGNGGSAAIASHAQNDLCKTAGVRAMVFNEPPLLTALANDDGYGSVFESPILLWGEPGDLLLTVSSSGQSESIIRAINAATSKQCHVITLSGFKADNPSRSMGDLNFYVASSVYGYVETAHTALVHYLTTSVPRRN
jgi:D-sedoheptulose 7-phosphate isomerase